MFRCLLRQFRRSIKLHSPVALNSTTLCEESYSNVVLQCRSISYNLNRNQSNTESVGSVATEETTILESNAAYIKPYDFGNEVFLPKNDLIEALRTRFRLSHADVSHIIQDEVVSRARKTPLVLHILELLCSEGVNKKSFVDYPWLLTLEKTRLEQKLALLRTLKVRDINHFVVFLRLSVTRLSKLVSSLKREADVVPHGNRIYYISDSLKTDPYIVTKFLHRRLFVLEMPYDMLKQNLEHMISYNVSPVNILRDLWAFRYTPKSVKVRLERAKLAKKDKIMPWMVRCPEPILQRSLKLSLDELEVLGDKTSTIEYVAERLQFQLHETKAIMDKHPQVLRVRVTKIKEVFDYLLNEAGFNRFEIAQVPRILCHSLKTTKQRLEELKSYGCRPTSLVIVCRSKREYEKFIKYWLSMQVNFDKKDAPQANQRIDEPIKT